MDGTQVQRAQYGDRDAFAAILGSVGDGLYAVAYRILRDPQLAQDAFQEASLAAWRQLPNLRDPDRFEAWIRRILIHACYAESRRRTRWTTHVRVLEADEEPSPIESGASIHDRDELERGFRRLTLEQRAVFVLHHHVGLPLVEVAEVLGIPAGTARSRLHYATQALRKALTVEPAIAPAERSA